MMAGSQEYELVGQLLAQTLNPTTSKEGIRRTYSSGSATECT